MLEIVGRKSRGATTREVQKVWKPQIRPRFRCKLLEDLDSLTHRRVSKGSEYVGIPAKFQFINCEASQNTFGTFWLKRQPELTLFIVWGQIWLYKVQPAFKNMKNHWLRSLLKGMWGLWDISLIWEPLGENQKNADILLLEKPCSLVGPWRFLPHLTQTHTNLICERAR